MEIRLNKAIAEKQVNKQKRYREILECLGNNEMTAKEISNEMYLRGYIPTNERNFTSPRITELLIKGVLEEVGSKKCEWTGKTVTIFKRRVDNGV